MDINRWDEDEIFETRNNAINILVWIFVHWRHSSRVAHPKIHSVGSFIESFSGEIDERIVEIIHEFGEIICEIWILSLNIANWSSINKDEN